MKDPVDVSRTFWGSISSSGRAILVKRAASGEKMLITDGDQLITRTRPSAVTEVL
jgi:hypothetical protein